MDQQLNGGIIDSTNEDWELILPYLEENERLFGIKVDDLLTVDGKQRLLRGSSGRWPRPTWRPKNSPKKMIEN